jgi:hypothetical protein
MVFGEELLLFSSLLISLWRLVSSSDSSYLLRELVDVIYV